MILVDLFEHWSLDINIWILYYRYYFMDILLYLNKWSAQIVLIS